MLGTIFATFETRRGLEPKCVPQLFLGWLLVTRRSAIGRFGPVPNNSPRSLLATGPDFRPGSKVTTDNE